MRGRNSKEDEDSGSDWDSMSEMDPAPKVEKKQASNQGILIFIFTKCSLAIFFLVFLLIDFYGKKLSLPKIIDIWTDCILRDQKIISI